jgi:ABC-type phosphate/phosphonate transport system substrate-binding protein
MKNIKTFLCFIMLLLVHLTVEAKPESIVGLSETGIRQVSMEEVELGFNYQLEKYAKDKNFTLKIKVYPNDEVLFEQIKQHKVQVYFGTPMMFFKHMDLFDKELLFSPVIEDKNKQRYLILARKSDKVQHLSDFKGAKLSYCISDAIGNLYLKNLLKTQKLGAQNSFFSKVEVKKNPNLALFALFFKETQLAVVLESDFNVASELNPQLKQQLQVIETSPAYITNLLAVAQSEAYLPKADIEAAVMSLGDAISTQSILKSFNYASMRKIKLDELDSVKRLVDSLGSFGGELSD